MLKTVGSRSILYVMAADAEYGPHLQARFTPLVCGVGPVESAVNLTRALASERPHIVISLGSAGSRTLEQAEVYEVASVSYRDMDASPLGFEKGRTPFLDLPAELPLTVMGDIPAKRLSTGANIVSGAAYDAIDADMVDMETFALLRACMMFDVPLVGLRGISDGADDLHHFDDWTQYLHVIDEKLAGAVDRIEAAIESGAAFA
ncbi:MAG: 5'-methylthioadenosine/S-adenosylhomocysteine nucleosidase [Roseitalea sp.]|uniref:5'-methylthioadenosine/S-adenosylhomocysteine nucleosidase n=1 Tax=Oceaniradius stylonematis TaxID=2184161 RepID=UPI001B016937|nr:5'-methylthioadenosine/S-adenosylhomocysteine nucleosidase [Oceaniradius stylonematis]MBO6553343.1 5'-methylthioadenosine/S-adenosylhomocysteine nucleosidase [Roseitalea sp.]MBO6952386.1 5'-methylthioadenosine/S-adenosylhomocysteine nucleosidase [Rhizobiaceae bacterium]MBO6593128.1 5'-methylthioadenosine/S-adenosylhomocysteine nucleosidase [Roseitalea sp.]MBO6600130.1 5'-methylthioadenosine/S-adenosylhomocysteine nucleosidase [Roseitalea sp.]MBO6613963.1 5'-methylthioadenosine/S-adenosylhom